MSTFLLVKNLHAPQRLTVRQILSLTEKLYVFKGATEVDESEENPEAYEVWLDQPLPNDGTTLVLGVDEVSVRGFEFFYHESDHYVVRVNTPAAIGDWEPALATAAALARSLNTTLAVGDGEEFTGGFDPDTLAEEVAWRDDIAYGIQVMREHLEKDDLHTLMLLGVARTMVVNLDMLSAVAAAEDPVQAFSDLGVRLQYPPAFIASQILAERDGDVVGVYVLSEKLATVLPNGKPSVELDYIDAVGDRVVDWKLVFMPDEEHGMEPIEVPYATFLAALPESARTPLDAGNDIVKAMSLEEFQAMVKDVI